VKLVVDRFAGAFGSSERSEKQSDETKICARWRLGAAVPRSQARTCLVCLPRGIGSGYALGALGFEVTASSPALCAEALAWRPSTRSASRKI
jgi:hypothetical protein